MACTRSFSATLPTKRTTVTHTAIPSTTSATAIKTAGSARAPPHPVIPMDIALPGISHLHSRLVNVDRAIVFYRIGRSLIDKLREGLNKAIRRPVGDVSWGYLVRKGFVGEAEDMPFTEGVQYLLKEWREVQAAHDSPTGTSVPLTLRDAALEARTDALSAIYATWAAHDPRLDSFRRSALRRRDPEALQAYALRRGPHPGFELLREDEAPRWVREQYDAIETAGEGEERIRELLQREQKMGRSDLAHLQFIEDGELRNLSVPHLGPLGELAKVSERLAGEYRWSRPWAAHFALTGAQPRVIAYSATAEVYYGLPTAAATRVTMVLDPALPASRVAELYADLRAQLEADPPRRTQSLKAYRLCEHVGPHVARFPATQPPPGPGRPRTTNPPGGLVYYTRPAGGHTWASLRQSWNERYPDLGEDGTNWKYSSAQNFTRDAQDLLQRLLDPRWGLENLPRRQRTDPFAEGLRAPW